jgi:hypothetical protein
MGIFKIQRTAPPENRLVVSVEDVTNKVMQAHQSILLIKTYYYLILSLLVKLDLFHRVLETYLLAFYKPRQAILFPAFSFLQINPGSEAQGPQKQEFGTRLSSRKK